MIRLEESKCGFVFWDQEPSNYTWFSWNEVQHMKKLMKWLVITSKKTKSIFLFLIIQFIPRCFACTGTSTSSRLRSSFRREESPNDWWFGWMVFSPSSKWPPVWGSVFSCLVVGWCTVSLNDSKPLIVYTPPVRCVFKWLCLEICLELVMWRASYTFEDQDE